MCKGNCYNFLLISYSFLERKEHFAPTCSWKCHLDPENPRKKQGAAKCLISIINFDLCPGPQPKWQDDKQQLPLYLPSCFSLTKWEHVWRHVCIGPVTVACCAAFSSLFFIRNDRLRVKSYDLVMYLNAVSYASASLALLCWFWWEWKVEMKEGDRRW